MANLIISGWRQGGNGMESIQISVFNLDEKYVIRARMYQNAHIPICILKVFKCACSFAKIIQQDVLKSNHVNNCRQVSAN